MSRDGIAILAIQNPGEDTALEIHIDFDPDGGALEAIEQYGADIQRGAFVSITQRDYHGNTKSVTHFIADRAGEQLYLQSNDWMYDKESSANVDQIGAVVASARAPLSKPEPELETFTVFGNNDYGNDFVAVVAATDATVHRVAAAEGCVDLGDEGQVDIHVILKGDYSNVESIPA